MQSDQPPASSSSLGTVPTDPNLFGVVDQRNAGPSGPAVAETAINIGPAPIMVDYRSAYVHSSRTPATWTTRLRGTRFPECPRRQDTEPLQIARDLPRTRERIDIETLQVERPAYGAQDAPYGIWCRTNSQTTARNGRSP